MIDWTDAALEAAFEKLQVDEKKDEWESYIRAALDAAVKAQGMLDRVSEAIEQGRILGRREALEEAAKVCEGDFDSEMQAYGKAFAAAIRALKEVEL